MLFLLLPIVFGCAEASKADKLNEDFLKNDKSNLSVPVPAPTTRQEIENEKLFVFVGEKISVEIRPSKDEIPFDQGFKAKYKVIENVYNDYPKDVIEFEAFDHYGYPPFAEYKTVLLFVSEHEGKLYHEKYQFFDVYQTKDGRWASCGDPFRFDDYHRKNSATTALEFAEPVTFDLKGFRRREQKMKFFAEPYFRVEGNKAVCLMGAYTDELFKIKKEGVLKERGLFK